MHAQDKSEGEDRPYWHHKRPSPLLRGGTGLGPYHLLDELPALMTYDEARVDRVRDREDWAESDASKSPSAPSSRAA